MKAQKIVVKIIALYGESLSDGRVCRSKPIFFIAVGVDSNWTSSITITAHTRSILPTV